MSSPLVSRPPYGEGHPRMPRAESGLPQGTPGGKGLPLSDDVPGYKTFVKPLEESGPAKPKEESIYRVDNHRDRGKAPSSSPMDKDWGGAIPTNTSPDSSGKTKYPYRDEKPNAHNASVEYVEAMWHLHSAPTRDILPGRPVEAATSEAILQGLNPEFVTKSQSCSVTLKRVDKGNLRWIFAVNCGNGLKVVRLKAARKKNVTQLSKMDLNVACSCPAWRWLGPEFHAKGTYQDPNTPLQGTASTPDIRDPDRQNKVCKHVAAVLAHTKSWVVDKKG